VRRRELRRHLVRPWHGGGVRGGGVERHVELYSAAALAALDARELEPALVVSGDLELAERFRSIFELPPKAHLPS